MIAVVAIYSGIKLILAISVMAMSLTLTGLIRGKNNHIDMITLAPARL